MARYTVDAKTLWPRLKAVPVTVLEELAEFGEPMVSEVLARNELLETKALSMIGWTSASMAVLLAAPPATGTGWFGMLILALVLAGAAAAVVALIFAARVLRLRSWQWPSQQEWFCDELLDDVQKLRRYHLGVWLRTHEEHSRCIKDKADALKTAQAAFILMAIALGATIGVSALSQWKTVFP